MATRTKTGMTHRAAIPDFFAEMLGEYVDEVRAAIVAKTGSVSNSLFLNRNGEPVTYQGYRNALVRAGQRVNEKHPEHQLKVLHTHAGRSTFAAALRSFQLQSRREGKETLSDADFCTLMDWKSMQSLTNYDIMTRSLEVSPLLGDFYDYFNSWADQNRLIQWM